MTGTSIEAKVQCFVNLFCQAIVMTYYNCYRWSFSHIYTECTFGKWWAFCWHLSEQTRWRAELTSYCVSIIIQYKENQFIYELWNWIAIDCSLRPIIVTATRPTPRLTTEQTKHYIIVNGEEPVGIESGYTESVWLRYNGYFDQWYEYLNIVFSSASKNKNLKNGIELIEYDLQYYCFTYVYR